MIATRPWLLLGVALLGAGVLSTATADVAAVEADDSRIDLLPPQQQALAGRMKAFMQRMDDKYFARITELNEGAAEEEHLREDTEYSLFDIRVTRGPLIEKAGRMLAVGHKTNPGRGDRELVWGRFYSLDIHPETPLVGMLHATIVLQFFADGSTGVGGWLDLMPGTRVDADLERLKALTDGYFATHDKDPALYRRLVCKGTHDTIAEYRRRPSCSGVSFYGPPVYRDDPAASYAFVEGLYEDFVDTYLDIAADRADDPVTAADRAAQDEMRKRWLVDQLFSDPFAREIVPFHIWSLANVPPVVKF